MSKNNGGNCPECGTQYPSKDQNSLLGTNKDVLCMKCGALKNLENEDSSSNIFLKQIENFL